MAGSTKTIRFTIKTVTEGGEEVQALGVNVRDLAEMITSTQKKMDKGLKTHVEAVGFEAVMNMIGKLNGMLGDLADAYRVQEENENRLATAMRNTMEVTEALTPFSSTHILLINLGLF